MPKVSVIIPVYNVEEYIVKCLCSTVNQSLQDIELIFVNDGSTDETEQVAQEYCAKDARLRLINQTNGGVSAARNRGMREARAGYVAFLDQDDVLHPQAMEIFPAAAAKKAAAFRWPHRSAKAGARSPGWLLHSFVVSQLS